MNSSLNLAPSFREVIIHMENYNTFAETEALLQTTPLPPLLPLLTAACGSLHLAVNTCGGTSTRKNCAMPGTLKKDGRVISVVLRP